MSFKLLDPNFIMTFIIMCHAGGAPSLALDFEFLMRVATLHWMCSIDTASVLTCFTFNLYSNIIRFLLLSPFYRCSCWIPQRTHMAHLRDHGSGIGKPGSEPTFEWSQRLSLPNLSVILTTYWWLLMNARDHSQDQGDVGFTMLDHSHSPFPYQLRSQKRERMYEKTRSHHVLRKWPVAAYTSLWNDGGAECSKKGARSFWKR